MRNQTAIDHGLGLLINSAGGLCQVCNSPGRSHQTTWGTCYTQHCQKHVSSLLTTINKQMIIWKQFISIPEWIYFKSFVFPLSFEI